MNMLYPIQLNPSGPMWFCWVIAIVGLALNLLLLVGVGFALAYGASKGWAAA